jgi:hypothetical protein
MVTDRNRALACSVPAIPKKGGLRYQLKEAGLLKGLALPYLGQQDDRLPWKPSSLVPRSKVVNYPTDFAPMCAKWIDKLSARGEQLTRALVSHYLRNRLNVKLLSGCESEL